MENKLFQKIVKDINKFILIEAKKNDWMWFYDMHQKEVVRCAEKLLKIYKQADKQIVIIACWLHDISKYSVKDKSETKKHHATHHLSSYNFTKKFLNQYNLEDEIIAKIAQCVLRHRNSSHKARTMEEKIVVVADTLSHFTSVFYFTHFKFHPESTLEFMAKNQLIKLERDWQDLGLLPGSKKIVEREYEVIKKLHENYFEK
jgi:HD superfamily phosphodiesterase